MGTYARYLVWVGVSIEEIRGTKSPFIERAMKRVDGAVVGGLRFQSIGMHGEIVGFGVVVQRVDWMPYLGTTNCFDSSVSIRAEYVLQHAIEIFLKHSMGWLVPKVYHHIDLGG